MQGKPSTNWSYVRWVAALLPVVCLLPFINKPFHLDDPVYVAVSQQIARAPADFYGFAMNWYGTAQPVWSFNQNPPGVSYYLALAGALLGWREWTLHLAMLLPAAMVGLGTAKLARRLDVSPLLAAAAAVLTPAFVVSSTNVMSDVAMLALYVWSVAWWVEGVQTDRRRCFALSAMFAALALLTKYFAVSLVPLLAVYTLTRRRGWDARVLWLLMPLSALVIYEVYSDAMYGQSLFTGAAGYAAQYGGAGGASWLSQLIIALTFTGGCLFPLAFYAPLALSRRALFWGAAVVAGCLLVPLTSGSFVPETLREHVKLTPMGVVFGGLFIAVGLFVLALAAHFIRHRRDADALLLVLWLLGTFVFSAFVNWTINARTLLPMAPPAGIMLATLIAPRLAEMPRWKLALPAVLAAAWSMWVAAGDYGFAQAAKSAAATIAEAYPEQDDPRRRLYFEGHWGFQYYMEAAGYEPLDLAAPTIKPGDWLAIPTNNTNLIYFNEAEPVREVSVAMPWRVATINVRLRAGFYSHFYGPLPYVPARVPPERYTVFEIIHPEASNNP